MRWVVVAIWALAIATGVAGCSPRDPYVTSQGAIRSGDWLIAQQMDRVTGAILPSASISGKASNSGVDDWAKPGVMTLTCFAGKPIVRFGFEFKVGTNDNSYVGYRFDDKAGRDVVKDARFQQEYRMVVLEERADVIQFVEELRGSTALYLRIRSLNAGRTSLIVSNLAGSDQAIDAAYANCPLAIEPVQATAKKKVS